MKSGCGRSGASRSSGTRPSLLVRLRLMLLLGVSLGLGLGHCQGDQGPAELLDVRRIAPDCTHAYTAICCTRALSFAAHFLPSFPAQFYLCCTYAAELFPVNDARAQPVKHLT